MVPAPPVRPSGLRGRTPYYIAAREWVMTTMVELEARAAQYRDDNWTRAEEDPDMLLDE